MSNEPRAAVLLPDGESYAIIPHFPLGIVTPQDLRTIAEVAEKYRLSALKLTSAARIALVGLKEEQVDDAWEAIGKKPGGGGNCVRSLKACPGVSLCTRGKQDSLAMGEKLDTQFHARQLPGKMKMGVSGCPFNCAQAPIKDIGLVGKKHGWTVLAGGSAGLKPRLADEIATGLSDDDAYDMVGSLIAFYETNCKSGERMGGMIDRMGLDTVKAGVVEIR
jgi:NAD(P)H-nitrite reductase large subunit